MRIAAVADFSIANSNYRARPLADLKQRGHSVSLIHIDNFDFRPLLEYDVVYFYRVRDQIARQAMQEVRDAGIGVVWDDDDNHSLVLAHDPREARKVTRGAGKGSGDRHRDVSRALKLADVVTTTSAPIAAYFEQAGAERVEVIENYLPPLYTAAVPAIGLGVVVVGWVGGSEHQADVERLGLAGVATRLLDRHPRIYFTTVGVDLGIRSDRYEYERHVRYDLLGNYVADFDIGLAPLTDSAFNRARSDVKVKEYAYARVPWLASPVGPYLGLGEREGGRLVPDDGWEQAIEELFLDEYRRRVLALRGRRWAETKTALSNLHVWEAVILEAAERARARKAAASGTAAAPAR
ncbi:hypothetical protein Q5424_22910 [Conexibacter sp. JD483]|uniref:hypothetical protein n=1 Tax=unclassified Conexibacter TaxID=2627773 RepID=UPI00271F4483|nr:MULTISPECIES: hypothetical protein [unclassified Conexibacter]MDO8184877.1 hypothetical protein [Conexibacter sp. CPCC 205706]MDO8196652.1 hypothetical protein [Conexibacter sp. CPCC 205762]MDR9371967.1 hypothetical protein [Conexibacter sp. JD483]